MFLLNRFLPKETKSPFLIDLPLYRRPQISKVFWEAWSRTSHYLKEAGLPIFIFALLVWFGVNFPRDLSLSATEQIQQSYASQLGQFIEPVFSYMGGDWRVGVSLIAAFAAREIFVPSVLLLFHQSETETITDSLIENMSQATDTLGNPIFTTSSVLALIVFFMLALQCLSTTAIMYSETKSKKFAWFQLVTMNLFAYFFAVIVFQLSSLLV